MIDSLNTPRAWSLDLAACVIVGIVLGVVGPFGSFFNDVLPVRLAYWITVCLLSGVLVGGTVRLIWSRAVRRGVGAWWWIVPAAVMISIPAAAGARLVAVALWPGIRNAVPMLEWYGQTVLIELVYLSAYVALHSHTAIRVAADPAPPTDDCRVRRPPPGRLGADVLCLQMEDHYVRLHTSEGSRLILSSMARAIDQIGDVEGLQVHRSWWVARHAVRGVEKDGRSLRLRLASGLTAPIARAKVAQIRAAGWLDAPAN